MQQFFFPYYTWKKGVDLYAGLEFFLHIGVKFWEVDLYVQSTYTRVYTVYVWSLQFEYSPYIWCVAPDTKSCDSNIPVKRLLHLANLVLWWSIVSVHWRWRIDQNKFVLGTDLLMVYYTVALAIVGWNLTDGVMQLHCDHIDDHQTSSK